MKDQSPQSKLSRSGDQLLRYPDKARIGPKDIDSSKRIVILIHGFTADASYLEQLMQDLADDQISIFVFEYACYRGIDRAAENLRHRLSLLDRQGKLSSKRITLVGHSMGGLVARYFVSLLEGDKYVRTVITLGTPHLGTLCNSEILPLIIEWSHSVASAAPIAFTPKSRSALQLIGHDAKPTLLDRLLKAPPPQQAVQFYSYSGGYPNIEFGKGFLKNSIAQHWLRKNLSKPNDGLVEELSSNIASEQFKVSIPLARHFNDYPEYSDTNHSNLVTNQGVALEVLDLILKDGQSYVPDSSAHLPAAQIAPKDAH